MTEEMTSWLSNLKAGDDILIAGCHFKSNPRRVERTTPSQIIVGMGEFEQRYLKRNGRRIGPSSGWIEMPTN